MAGLLGDVLPWVYSQGDRLKRNVNGLLSDPLGSFAQTAGDIQDKSNTLQGLLDQVHAGDRGKPLQQATDMAMNGLLNFAPAGITVWHGSPAAFSKFDSSKIGTGEGAQAYGHGLYLAEAPEVAQSYAQSVKANADELVKRGVKRGLPADVASNLAAALQSGKKFDPLLDAARQTVEHPLAAPAQREAAQRLIQHEMPAYEAWSEWSKPGNLYKVDLPDQHVANMLDWDKPLDRQPINIREAARMLDDSLPPSITGKDFYNRLMIQARDGAIARGQNAQTTLGASQAAASEDLRAFGIPGIRYADGMSRGTGQGTSNFVVFPGEESLLQILERNGQPLR